MFGTGDFVSGQGSHHVSREVTSLSLLERLRNLSDDDAWRRFHDLYGPLIHSWLAHRGVSQADAEDVRQEVMHQAMVELPHFQHNGRTGALRCWLRQVVANRLRTFWRQHNRHRAVGGDEYSILAEQLADPESRLSQQWNHDYDRTLLQRLMEIVQHEFETKTIDAFRRVVFEEQKAAVVAEELKMTSNAVRIAQSRVLHRLREIGAGMIE